MIRVLVVDDDFMVARIHVGFVDRVDGFEVVGVAHSGAEAAEAVARLRPDLLLLDLYLPDRFGLDLLADLRSGPYPCDAIVITAAKEGEAVRSAVRLGVADYLLKPFGFTDLEERLRRYAAQRHLLDSTEVRGQEDVDRAFVGPARAQGPLAALPKGMSAETARLVEDALRDARHRRLGDRGGRSRGTVPGERASIPRAPRDDRSRRRAAPLRLDRAPRAPLPLGGMTVANAPAAGHALDVLALIARRGEPVPAAAIARDLGLPRSSVYHLLGVLADRGYVRHVPEERRYGLGLAAYELGSAYQRQAPLERMARGVMDRLVDTTGHSAHLAVLHGRDVLYVIEQRAPGRPHLVTDVGVRLPAALTASGMAMLAALPAAQVRALYPGPGGAGPAGRPRPDVDDAAACAAAGRPPARPCRRGRPRHRRPRLRRGGGARPQRLPGGGGGRDLPPGRRRCGGDGPAGGGRARGRRRTQRPPGPSPPLTVLAGLTPRCAPRVPRWRTTCRGSPGC